MQQKKSPVSANFFRQKVLLWPKQNSHLIDQAEKIAFPSLNYDQKVKFWPFLAFLACCVQHCSHSRASVLVQLASLESFDLFYAGGSTRKSLWGPGGPIQEQLFFLFFFCCCIVLSLKLIIHISCQPIYIDRQQAYKFFEKWLSVKIKSPQSRGKLYNGDLPLSQC